MGRRMTGMGKMGVAVACWVAAQAGAQETVGSHGMALFGDETGLYASHLPMFHPPHDYQVILRLRLADPEQERALRARLGGTALWTIDPERFALARLAPSNPRPLRSFRADVFQGHFERGGQRAYAQARFVVEQVVYYQRLDPAPRRREDAVYLPVGSFLVKRLDRRPDTDHIVRLAAPASAQLKVPLSGLSNPEPALARRVPVLGTVYFETGDLR